jgi:hypothetical protein
MKVAEKSNRDLAKIFGLEKCKKYSNKKLYLVANTYVL